jgi:beta-phosphoglucomutase-like phosphatase (HAD superfamily)
MNHDLRNDELDLKKYHAFVFDFDGVLTDSSATPDDEITQIVSRRELSKYFMEVLGSGRPKADNLLS